MRVVVFTDIQIRSSFESAMGIKQYSVEELQPGMILAQPITDPKGRIMIPAGGRLTPVHIARMPKMGITTVAVEIEEPTPAEGGKKPLSGKEILESASSEDREFMRRIALQIQERFSNLPDTPLNNELKRLALKHLILNGRGVVPGLK